jgi:hypothetical protein
MQDLHGPAGFDERGEDLALWEARAEYAVGVLIRRYLADHPPPETSGIAFDLQHWAHALALDGRERLRMLGEGHLRAVEPEG